MVGITVGLAFFVGAWSPSYIHTFGAVVIALLAGLLFAVLATMLETFREK